MHGNRKDLGLFDECNDFKHNTEYGVFEGKYCLLSYQSALMKSKPANNDTIFDMRET